MPIDCVVLPRPGATPDELKALGSALLRWYVRECKSGGIACSVDTEALVELLNGRLPAPRVPRRTPVAVPSVAAEPSPGLLNGYELPALSVERLRDALALARRPAALLRLNDCRYDRGHAIASLRRDIPAE